MDPVLIVDETHVFRRAEFEAAVSALSLPGGGRPQHGTSMHYPDCPGARCSGCLPPVLVGEIVGPDEGPLHGVIPGRAWDAATVVDGWATDDLSSDIVFGVDVASDPADRSLVFAQVRDGIVRVHVPDVR